jgi:hypothetical protein
MEMPRIIEAFLWVKTCSDKSLDYVDDVDEGFICPISTGANVV